MEKDNESTGGPRVARSVKQAHGYSKRVIIFFLLALAAILGVITYQSSNKSGDAQSQARPGQNYRAPQPLNFAELAAGMRGKSFAELTSGMKRSGSVSEDSQKNEPERQNEPKRQPQRIVIEGTRTEPPPLPRYYSQEDDAQAAGTLRTLKIQALTAKPIAEGFTPRTNTADGTAGGGAAAQTNPARTADSAALAALAREQVPDPNGQARKGDFLREGGGALTPQGYSANFPVPQQFPYELKAGTIIPGIMLTGINSDLPGGVIGQVSENVWDTATGRYVLIPKGTRILGVYDSQVTFGQNRVLLVWNRMVFPNGTALDITGSPGTDQAGYSGLSGRVNEHWGTMLKSALLASVFVAGAEIVYDRDAQSGYGGQNRSPSDVAAESAAGAILDMGTKLMNKASDIQPTISIRPGKKMGIFVQKDIVFPSPYLW